MDPLAAPQEIGRVLTTLVLDSSTADCPISQFTRIVLDQWQKDPHCPLQSLLSQLGDNYSAEEERLALQEEQCVIARDKLRAELHRVEAQLEKFTAQKKEAILHKHYAKLVRVGLAADSSSNATFAEASATSQQMNYQKLQGGSADSQQPSFDHLAPPSRKAGEGEELEAALTAATSRHQQEHDSGGGLLATFQRTGKSSSSNGAANENSSTYLQGKPEGGDQGLHLAGPTGSSPSLPSGGLYPEIEAVISLLGISNIKEQTLTHALSRCESYVLMKSEQPWESMKEYETNLTLGKALVRHLSQPRPPTQMMELRILTCLLQRSAGCGVPNTTAAAFEDVMLTEQAVFEVSKLLESVNDDVKCEALQSLTLLIRSEAACQDFLSARAVGPLVNIIATSTSEAVLEKAHILLWTVAVNDEVKQEVRNRDGVRAVVELLYTDSVTLLENVVIALGFLTRDEQTKILMRECDGLEKLVSTLYHPDSSIQEKAAGAIWNCAANNENRSYLRHLGAIPALLELLNSESETVQENASGALWNLTVDGENRLHILEYGGLSILLPLLSSRRAMVVENVSGVLWNCSSVVEVRPAIRKLDGIPKILSILTHSSPHVVENIAGAIRNLVINDQNKSAFRENGGMETILDLIENVSPPVLDKFVSTLWITTVSPENKHGVRTAGGFPKLIRLLVKSAAAMISSPSGGIYQTITEKIIGTLRNCSTVLENKQALMDAGVIAALVGIFSSQTATASQQVGGGKIVLSSLHQYGANVREGVSAVIWNLSRENKDVPRVEGGLSLLCAFLSQQVGLGSSSSSVLNDGLIEHAAGGVSSLTVTSVPNRDHVRNVGGLQALLQLLAIGTSGFLQYFDPTGASSTMSGVACAVNLDSFRQLPSSTSSAPPTQQPPSTVLSSFALHNVILSLRNLTSNHEANQRQMLNLIALDGSGQHSLHAIHYFFAIILCHLSLQKKNMTAQPTLQTQGGGASTSASSSSAFDDVVRESILCLKNISMEKACADEIISKGKFDGYNVLTAVVERGGTESIRKAAPMALQALARTIRH